MERKETLYSAQSNKSVHQFVEDFAQIIEENKFVINNKASMNMSKTLQAHGGEVPDNFDLHMLQVCKPTKADKSLTTNPERAVLMPKFIHVFSKNETTQIRYLSFQKHSIAELVPGDESFPASLEQTYTKIRSMIREAI